MPDGKLYDGRYWLQGDLKCASKEGMDIQNPKEMAEYFGVSLEEYEIGQKWYMDNPDKRHNFHVFIDW